MITEQFSIDINASAETVWNLLWDDAGYRQWTSAFCEGSYAESNWNEGDKVLFLAPDGGGMSSIIEKKIPNEYMSFRHVYEVKNGEELPLNEKSEQWSGAHENYTLSPSGNGTRLVVDVDISETEKDFMSEKFPKALQSLKALAESQ